MFCINKYIKLIELN